MRTAHGSLARIDIDTRQLAQNVLRVRSLLKPDTVLMAVVKGDGYGHGLVLAANVALSNGACRLGVAHVAEGACLRRNGISAPIHLLGAWDASQADDIVRYSLIPGISNPELAVALNERAKAMGATALVHIKIDTGLHRLGLEPDAAVAFAQDSRRLGHILVEGVYTHMACADDGCVSETEEQYRRFVKTVEQIESLGVEMRFKHVASSSLIVDRPDMHLDMVRAGIILYGYGPLRRHTEISGVKPCLSLSTRLVQVRPVPSGHGIGYSHTFRTARDSTIGTIPVGYVDGLRSLLCRGGEVLIKGQKCPIVGKICMDHAMVDVTDVPDARLGDPVVLIGVQGDHAIWADWWAEVAHCTVEEVLSGISHGRFEWRLHY